MSEDPEIKKINEKKLKSKGAKVVEKRQPVNYEGVVMQLSQLLNDEGLMMMNTATQLRNLIAGERERVAELQKNNSQSVNQ